jgi:hypothetical protein
MTASRKWGIRNDGDDRTGAMVISTLILEPAHSAAGFSQGSSSVVIQSDAQ